MSQELDLPEYLRKLEQSIPLANKWQDDAGGKSVTDVLSTMGIMIGMQLRNEEDLPALLNIISLAALTTKKFGNVIKTETEH